LRFAAIVTETRYLSYFQLFQYKYTSAQRTLFLQANEGTVHKNEYTEVIRTQKLHNMDT
jgi:hypothetical protein